MESKKMRTAFETILNGSKIKTAAKSLNAPEPTIGHQLK